MAIHSISSNDFCNDRLRQLEITNDIFLQNVAVRLQRAIRENPEGFTFDLLTMRLKTKFMSGIYLVGQDGHDQIYKRVPAFSKLVTWLSSNITALKGRGAFIGGWQDSEKRFLLDVVATVTGRYRALIAGRTNNEDAIYCPYTGETIEVNSLLTLPSPQPIRLGITGNKIRREA